jgi:hypothetical protein
VSGTFPQKLISSRVPQEEAVEEVCTLNW